MDGRVPDRDALVQIGAGQPYLPLHTGPRHLRPPLGGHFLGFVDDGEPETRIQLLIERGEDRSAGRAQLVDRRSGLREVNRLLDDHPLSFLVEVSGSLNT